MPASSMSAEISIRISVVDVPIPRVDVKAITSSFAASLLARDPNDVCFYFPRNNRRLWANESVLRSKSTYFETLFSSDFAESSSTGAIADTMCPSPRDLPPYTYAESDVEDDIRSFTSSADHEAERKVSEKFPFKMIKVLDTTFTTYFSVLLWLSTGHISFAPLLSTFSGDSAFSNSVLSQQALRRNAVQLEKTKNPGLPVPVSPKSVYRLAHLLELNGLAAFALSNFETQLAPSGALFELYGDVSCAYPEIQERALDYVVKHWDHVKGTAAARAVEKKLQDGGGNEATALIGFQLAKRLGERFAK